MKMGRSKTCQSRRRKEKLRATYRPAALNYPTEAVAVYLHAFHDMDSTVSWPPLGEVLAEDERLKLGSQQA